MPEQSWLPLPKFRHLERLAIGGSISAPARIRVDWLNILAIVVEVVSGFLIGVVGTLAVLYFFR